MSNNNSINVNTLNYKNVEIDSYNMKYIDEGEGEIILFSHGTPSSSFQFRKIISALSNSYRCISADLIGMGKSDKPQNTECDYSIKAHSKRLASFIDKIQIKPKFVYGHDFGFPILIGALFQNNNLENIKKIFISNTWLWDLRDIPHFKKTGQIPEFLVKFLYLNMNVSPRYLMKTAFFDINKLTQVIHNEYINPFPTKQERTALFEFYKHLLHSGDFYAYLYENRSKIDNIDKVLVWGMNDKLIPADLMLPKWQSDFSNIKLEKIEQAGHFPDEEQSEKVIEVLRRYM